MRPTASNPRDAPSGHAQLAPSVNFPRQSVSDATEIVRPFTMRGLSPDHSLVLVNGKRRHRTALIHYYGAGQGAGSSDVDMNAIPAGARNLFDVYPDRMSANNGFDIFPFPPASPFGYNGRWVYARLELARR